MNNRFYINDSFEDSPTIEGSEFHHLVHVMRAQNGDEIELVNGHGVLASARIETIKKKSASLRILHREKQSKPSPSLISAIAILRMEKLDWAIEKATELGADAITLFPAEHSEKKQLSENQVERLRNISIAAMKQCGRLYLPAIAILSSLERVLELDAMTLFGDTDPKAPMLEAIPNSSPILFITGPEKGFSTSEDALLKQRAKGVRLHMNILRAETAPIVALSLLSRTLK